MTRPKAPQGAAAKGEGAPKGRTPAAAPGAPRGRRAQPDPQGSKAKAGSPQGVAGEPSEGPAPKAPKPPRPKAPQGQWRQLGGQAYEWRVGPQILARYDVRFLPEGNQRAKPLRGAWVITLPGQCAITGQEFRTATLAKHFAERHHVNGAEV